MQFKRFKLFNNFKVKFFRVYSVIFREINAEGLIKIYASLLYFIII